MAAWNAKASGSSCDLRRSSIGVRSAPPPNQARVVITRRVFICAVGACGFHGWAINEMPVARKCGSASAPGICLANSGEKRAVHGRYMHADLLEDPALEQRHDAAAAGRAVMVGALPRLAAEAPGRSGRPVKNGPTACVSIVSNSAQRRSRSDENQPLALSARDLIAGLIRERRQAHERGGKKGMEPSIFIR